MNRVLILFAHPRFEKSRINRALLEGVETLPGVTLRDLYEIYPDFNIDTARERELLASHDVIVWHFPFYLYSAPALLKQWMDWVLEHGWAHGTQTLALKGKTALVALTLGGTRSAYEPGGYHRFTLREFLVPFEQTAGLCRMTWIPPFAVHGTYLLTGDQLAWQASQYRLLLDGLTSGRITRDISINYEYLNDWLTAGEEGDKVQP
jgi:glutathione-regulated potassium-efflux system ancillary protein KefG